MAVTRDGIVHFFDDELGIDTADITPQSLLFSAGIIDSFALVSLMTYIEDESGIRISPADVNLANLDSIERILAYVDRALNDMRA